MVEQHADASNIHARWCSGGCPRWVGSGLPTCLPNPCLCAQTKATAPEWRRTQGDVKCWWYSSRKGRTVSYCPCWNGPRDGRPGDCCAHHSLNVRYQDVSTLLDPAAGTGPQDAPEPPTEPAGWHAPHERADWLDDEEPWGRDPARERKPYVRRWKPEELLCACP